MDLVRPTCIRAYVGPALPVPLRTALSLTPGNFNAKNWFCCRHPVLSYRFKEITGLFSTLDSVRPRRKSCRISLRWTFQFPSTDANKKNRLVTSHPPSLAIFLPQELPWIVQGRSRTPRRPSGLFGSGPADLLIFMSGTYPAGFTVRG